MKIFTSGSLQFDKALKRIDSRMEYGPSGVEDVVAQIIGDIRKRGDKALFACTKKFDRLTLTEDNVRVSEEEIDRAESESDRKVVSALKKALARIKRFHNNQKEKSWTITEDGARLGQIIGPLQSVGIYVPGGAASYPSSVLMNAVPASIAGVERIVMVTPAPDGYINPHALVAARLAKVTEIYRVGGAQGVAALAFGTGSIKPVDKIVGPGNVYVAEAKRQVFGKVDIDMVAGPSEILVVADDSADPAHIAGDLLSQAEHDANAYPILVTDSGELAQKVSIELKEQTKRLDRKEIIRACLKKNCYALVTQSIDEAIEISNRIAPEHLEIITTDAAKRVKQVKNAGAIFVGPWTPEALGDYMAGPNHVLPTGGSARFFSPLGVYDFMKRTSILNFTKKGLTMLADDVIALAREEKLTAHARAVEMRVVK